MDLSLELQEPNPVPPMLQRNRLNDFSIYDPFLGKHYVLDPRYDCTLTLRGHYVKRKRCSSAQREVRRIGVTIVPVTEKQYMHIIAVFAK
jgi:hypothetical protein